MDGCQNIASEATFKQQEQDSNHKGKNISFNYTTSSSKARSCKNNVKTNLFPVDDTLPSNEPELKKAESSPQSPAIPQEASSSQNQCIQQRPYCSQNSLLGLLNGTPSDPDCPNIARHGSYGPDSHHALNGRASLTALRAQFARSLDRNCDPLNIKGSRGVLSKITPASHGYTLIGKGTIAALIPHLHHERRTYRHMPLCKAPSSPSASAASTSSAHTRTASDAT